MRADRKNLAELDLRDLLVEARSFFPPIEKAIKIVPSLPCETCTIERSFSTLRRVKTWLRSTMVEQRLSVLCSLNVDV